VGEATTASFDSLRLHPATLQALDRMGIETPTPIQAQALPALLAGRDVIGQARTGSGKTLAFGIPAVEMVDPAVRAVQVLVLTPTRELAVQVGSVLDEVGAGRGVRSVLIFGGRAAGPQIAALRRGAPIVVGTPGRVLDLLNQGALNLSQVRFLILDEADEMLDRGFAPDVERILDRTPRTRQTALFSATVPAWVNETAHTHLSDPVRVMVDPSPEDAAPIEHIAYEVVSGDKIDALRTLLDQRGDGSIIVFGRTKHGVKKLAKKLAADGYPVGALQGNLSQNARDRVMDEFRSGQIQILLATNVAARGLDITHVDQVINVELPESPELLTHRVGRTGRMGRQGQAITLLAPDDAAKWRQLERGLGRRIQRAPWPITPTAAGAERDDLVARTGDALPRRVPTDPPALADPDRRTNRGSARSSRRASMPPIDHTQASVNRPQSREQSHRPRTSRVRYPIVCAGCGQQAEAPFQPNPSRPVYCATCFAPRRRTGRGYRVPS
jgi:ATP-dependent RNA helicase DeaD